MASKCEYSDQDTLFVGRFVYEVLAYTLTKCGFPESKLPKTDCEENDYHKDKFVKIAGASVLRIALILRENWKKLFMSKRESFGSNSYEVSLCLGVSAVSYPLSRTRTAQSTVELILALCNEVFLFLHQEDIHIDHLEVMKSVSSYILLICASDQNIPEKIEGYFDEFENIVNYTKWITTFIKKYAIPYGSRYDVPYLFCKRIKTKFLNLKKASPPGTPSMDLVKVHLGYIPMDILPAIIDEESELLPEHLVTASGSAMSDDHKSQDPTKFPATSGTVVQAKSKLRGRRLKRSKNIPEQTVKGEKSIKNPPETGIEDNLGRKNLVAEEVSQTSHGELPKQKPDNVPEQTAKDDQIGKNPLEVGIEDVFGQMSLVADGNSQASHGAIPKRKSAKKKRKNSKKSP